MTLRKHDGYVYLWPVKDGGCDLLLRNASSFATGCVEVTLYGSHGGQRGVTLVDAQELVAGLAHLGFKAEEIKED